MMTDLLKQMRELYHWATKGDGWEYQEDEAGSYIIIHYDKDTEHHTEVPLCVDNRKADVDNYKLMAQAPTMARALIRLDDFEVTEEFMYRICSKVLDACGETAIGWGATQKIAQAVINQLKLEIFKEG